MCFSLTTQIRPPQWPRWRRVVCRPNFGRVVQKNRNRLPAMKSLQATFSLPVNHSQTCEKKQLRLTEPSPTDFAFGSREDRSKGTAIALQKMYSARKSLQNTLTLSGLVLYGELFCANTQTLGHKLFCGRGFCRFRALNLRREVCRIAACDERGVLLNRFKIILRHDFWRAAIVRVPEAGNNVTRTNPIRRKHHRPNRNNTLRNTAQC